MEYLNTMNDQTKESRALFLGWCKMHHLKILNSQFSKPLDRLITHKEKKNVSDFGPPFDAERYAQIDYWLTNSTWKTACTDAQSRRDVPFDSGHLVVEAQFEMKPDKRVQEPKTSKKFLKPTLAQWNCFNTECAQTLSRQSLCLSKFVRKYLARC